VARPFKPGLGGDEAIDTPDKEMAFVGVGHPLQLREDHPDYPALVMVNHLLGGSASARLLERLRQKEGLSYGAFSGLHGHPLDDGGFFYAAAICAPQNADRALALIGEELQRLLKDGVGAEELASGKGSYAQTFASQIAEDDFVGAELAQGLYLDRTFAFWRDLNARIEKLTPDQVTAAARKYIHLEKLGRIQAGDQSKRKKS
jgi:zinc protease